MPGHNFKKKFGQNFLTDRKVSQKIASQISTDIDSIVEIGPGHGALTEELLKLGKKVYAIEIDEEVYPYLEGRFSEFEIFHLIKKDILQINLNELNLGNYSVAGSLPYNISKKIIFLFLTAQTKPNNMILLIQNEVAEDYAAKAPRATFLSNFAEIYSDVEYLSKVSKGKFFPSPKVDGGILKFSVKDEPKNAAELRKLIKTGFSSPRKTVLNNLKSLYKESLADIRELLKSHSISETVRPAELDIANWMEIYSIAIR
jgi:16S rRNA (adenine1518-N6/adenine1519-N6)-dimethyltransferase